MAGGSRRGGTSSVCALASAWAAVIDGVDSVDSVCSLAAVASIISLDWACSAGFSAGVSAALSSSRIRLPSVTLSPTLTLTSLTVPAAGDGISMDALSDSSVSSESSGLTVSPAWTSTSITSTSLKSPMSGTFISCMGMSLPLHRS